KVSYIGYSDQQVTVGNKTSLEIVLQEDSQTLNEVVVVGYGTMKKSDLTGSVSSVNSDKIAGSGATSLSASLQGSVPGVNITPSSSRAGGGINMQIRGQTSINNQSSPLYVIDGVVCSSMDFLNPEDIERVDVLKDASSTAIYGSRASAGVVMITTKGGKGATKAQKATISYDGYYGIKKIARMPDFMNAQQFMDYRIARYNQLDSRNSQYRIAGGVYGVDAEGHPHYKQLTDTDLNTIFIQENATAEEPNPMWNNSRIFKQYMLAKQGGFDGYDWKDLVTQTAAQQNHFISASGSSDNMSYRLGLGYQNEENVLKNNDYERFNIKASFDSKLSKIFEAGVSTNMAYSVTEDFMTTDDLLDGSDVQESSASPYYSAFYFAPYVRPYDDNGNLIVLPGAAGAFNSAGAQFTSNVSPLLDLIDGNNKDQQRDFHVMASMYLRAHIMDGLQFTTTFSPNYYHGRRGRFFGTGLNEHNTMGSMFYQKYGFNYGSITNTETFEWTWDNQVDYHIDLGKNKEHSLNAMALFSLWKRDKETNALAAKDISNDAFTYHNLGASAGDKAVASSYTESSLVSFAGRLNYSYLGKYMATATLRTDGSSRFADGNRWGWFPSFAVAWRASEESFLKDNVSWLSNTKLRLSYGVTGNNNVSDYITMNTADGPHYFELNNALAQGYYTSKLVNTDLVWEKVKEFDAGIDLGFLNNRINLTFDWYNRISDGQIMQQSVPIEAGAGSSARPWVNMGSVRNRGVEIGINANIIETKDFSWSATLNWARNWNKILDTSTGVDETSGDITKNYFIGQPLNVLYDYTRAGVITKDGVTMHTMYGDKHLTLQEVYDTYGKAMNWYEGQEALNDWNFDGTIDDNDKQIYGCTDPRWTGSLSTTLTYKGFDFTVMLYTKSGFWSRSYFHQTYLNTHLRGVAIMPYDYYIPEGAWYINDNGELAQATETHYGSYPYPDATNFDGAGAYSNNSNMTSSQNYKYQKTSFTKVKNITLGYTFPKPWINKIGLQHLRLYVNVINPFVFTNYDGFDPEWASASLTNGGPSSVTYQFGVNLKF
ncbi:MAG: TonB-dependent receptor, partial [Prevotella sp.]|nr:TonB-dependent receptor [Prevotella sp.]